MKVSRIKRAADGFRAFVEHMSVDHGGLYIFVPKQFLDGADIVAILEQVSGERVSEGMRGNRFGYF